MQLRRGELPEQLLHVALRIEEIKLVLQGHQWRTEFLVLNSLGFFQRATHPFIQHLKGRQNPLRTDGSPIGGPHILHYAIGHAPPFFFRDQDVVGGLLRPDVRHAEIQYIPAERQIGGENVLLR